MAESIASLGELEIQVLPPVRIRRFVDRVLGGSTAPPAAPRLIPASARRGSARTSFDELFGFSCPNR